MWQVQKTGRLVIQNLLSPVVGRVMALRVSTSQFLVTMSPNTVQESIDVVK